MYLPRDGLRNRSILGNTGSIRDNHEFEDELGSVDFSSKKTLPGPGDYIIDGSCFSTKGRPVNM